MTTTLQAMNDVIHFTAISKMAPKLIEQCIDSHLMRIIKLDGLENLNKTLQLLSTKNRICEKILVILAITNLIVMRNIVNIQHARRLLIELQKIAAKLSNIKNVHPKNMFATKFVVLKMTVKFIEQLFYPLNANTKHLKYILRIHHVPALYKTTNNQSLHFHDLLKKNICLFDEIIIMLHDIINTLRLLVLKIYANVN